MRYETMNIAQGNSIREKIRELKGKINIAQGDIAQFNTDIELAQTKQKRLEENITEMKSNIVALQEGMD